MKTCCLLNHFNYGRFVGAALDSVRGQTVALDEIVVVDDGSGTSDLEALRQAVGDAGDVTLVENGSDGQLACFELGLRASEAEIVFFLDADDTWDPNYVERVVGLFAATPALDMVLTNERRCFEDGREEVTERPSRDLGYAVVRSLNRGGAWHGQPTSCIAMRRRVLNRIFPLPLARGWRTCADEALVYGAAIVGARRSFLGEPLVRYRIHSENHFQGRKYDAGDRLMRGLEVLRLVECLRQRESLPACLAHLAHHEFRSIEQATKAEYREYRRLVKGSNLPSDRRRRVLMGLWSWHRLRRRF